MLAVSVARKTITFQQGNDLKCVSNWGSFRSSRQRGVGWAEPYEQEQNRGGKEVGRDSVEPSWARRYIPGPEKQSAEFKQSRTPGMPRLYHARLFVAQRLDRIEFGRFEGGNDA